MADLTDFEEMVISLVHPLVQANTIPRTGELAYVGHVCNFRQNVDRFMSTLPVLPQDMPTLFVRPRQSASNPDRMKRKPFEVNMVRLRAAFAWLKEHNHHYRDIPWDDDAAAAWEGDPELPSREEDIDTHGDVAYALFTAWMTADQTAQASESEGFEAARTLFDQLHEAENSDDDTGTDMGKVWYTFLDTLAKLRDKEVLRIAQSVTTLDVGYVVLQLQRMMIRRMLRTLVIILL